MSQPHDTLVVSLTPPTSSAPCFTFYIHNWLDSSKLNKCEFVSNLPEYSFILSLYPWKMTYEIASGEKSLSLYLNTVDLRNNCWIIFYSTKCIAVCCFYWKVKMYAQHLNLGENIRKTNIPKVPRLRDNHCKCSDIWPFTLFINAF